jgi:hypothetical protein
MKPDDIVRDPWAAAIRVVLEVVAWAIVFAALFVIFLWPNPAHATGSHTLPPQTWDQRIDVDASASAAANAASTATTGPSQSSVSGVSAGGGNGGSAGFTDSSRSSLYVFPPPAAAAPLPGTVCPKGDSLAWSIGWGFFSYAVSSTRTELDCLERWVSLMRATAPAPQAHPLLLIPPPAPAASAPTHAPEPAKPAAPAPKPEVKRISAAKPKSAATAAPACADGKAPVCTAPSKPRT